MGKKKSSQKAERVYDVECLLTMKCHMDVKASSEVAAFEYADDILRKGNGNITAKYAGNEFKFFEAVPLRAREKKTLSKNMMTKMFDAVNMFDSGRKRIEDVLKEFVDEADTLEIGVDGIVCLSKYLGQLLVTYDNGEDFEIEEISLGDIRTIANCLFWNTVC